jgi:hypothetical protein
VQIKLKKTTYKKVIVFLKERKQNKHVGSCVRRSRSRPGVCVRKQVRPRGHGRAVMQERDRPRRHGCALTVRKSATGR